MGRKQITIKCDNPECNIEYKRDLSECERNIHLGRKSFCSLACKGKMYANLLKSTENIRKQKISYAKYLLEKPDEYNGVKEHLRRIRNRCKAKGAKSDLDLEYLTRLWGIQDGRCIYTGIKLVNPHYRATNQSKIYTSSVDRIDSEKGYVKGNVQFVSMAINFMKSTLTDNETKELIKIIRESK